MRIRRETDGSYGSFDACSLGSRIEGAGAAVGRSLIGSVCRWRLLPGEEWSRPRMSRWPRSAMVSSFLLSSQTTGRTEIVGFRVSGSRAGRNLVDPASSHMLVSKIKPCMSQYKLLYGETANGSLKQL